VDVCLNSLSKIYTLPNIEIQDAFVKLREQVQCYFQLPSHYRTGLDIINSTNLDYFGPQQKAEFFQLKGEFLCNMGYILLSIINLEGAKLSPFLITQAFWKQPIRPLLPVYLFLMG